MTKAEPARIHLLPAKAAPIVVILRRKPSKCLHVIRWNTKTNRVEHGSWFRGKLYPKRCDVSFDGTWMVYLAMGASGNTWNGICRLPRLRTVAEGESIGAWFGGGYWESSDKLLLNCWKPSKGDVPFGLDAMSPEFGGEDLGVLYPRLTRDGWTRRGDDYGRDRRVGPKWSANLRWECIGDDGWQHRPSRTHPFLYMHYAGYLEHGYTFRFSLEDHPTLLDDEVDWACWDALGGLVYSRRGVVFRYERKRLRRGEPSFVLDLESLEPPWREASGEVESGGKREDP